MISTLIAAGGRFGRMHDGDFHPFLGLLSMVALGAIVGLVVLLVMRRRPVAPPPPSAPFVGTAPGAVAVSPTAGAEAILAERLARGEIDTDDYRTRLDALRGTSTPSAPPAG